MEIIISIYAEGNGRFINIDSSSLDNIYLKHGNYDNLPEE